MATDDPLAHALAGAGGGILSMCLTYPLITASTRLQVTRQTPTPSTVNLMSSIIQHEGISGLFSGLQTALVGIALTNGVYYYFYELARSGFIVARGGKRGEGMSVMESMAAGAIAGSATVLMTNPIWTRMTAKKESMDEPDTVSVRPRSGSSGVASSHRGSRRRSHSSRTVRTILRILKHDGPLAFFSGVVPALILVINPILQYTTYEQLGRIVESRLGRKLGGLHVFILGAISKLVATGLTYPYIVVKSRMQLRQSNDPNQRYEQVWKGLKRIVAEEGVAGLYKGLRGKLLQSVLTAALLFYTKEKLYKYAVVFLLVSGIRQHPSKQG